MRKSKRKEKVDRYDIGICIFIVFLSISNQVLVCNVIAVFIIYFPFCIFLQGKLYVVHVEMRLTEPKCSPNMILFICQ